MPEVITGLQLFIYDLCNGKWWDDHRDRDLNHETLKYEDVQLRNKSFVNVPYLRARELY
jgi:hypothetical protein